MFPVTEEMTSVPSVELGIAGSAAGSSPSSSLLFNLSVLKDKLNQVQTLMDTVILSPNQSQPESTSMAISSMNSTIHEIIVTATSMMLTCQHMALTFPPPATTTTTTTTTCTNELYHQQQSNHNRLLPLTHHSNFGNNNNNIGTDIRGQSLFSNTESETLDWFGESYNNNNDNNSNIQSIAISEANNSKGGENEPNNNEGYKYNHDDIIELDAEDLLAKYTHYCQVCGKGFKRDANLRMHMRAHGDEYKTNAALSNPIKSIIRGSECDLMSSSVKHKKKYSCPQEGCRWNQKHAKFQPLKSMVCAKNHYKRSHCPKMYVCKRCNQKQFSVLSDLRTHEKHCGDLKWQCSCGTTFSRKDKLMGHVALFVGHHPAIINA